MHTLLFSTQPSSHPIHSLQHTRLILVKERPEMLNSSGPNMAYKTFPVAPASTLRFQPHLLPPTAPATGKTSCLMTHHTLWRLHCTVLPGLCSERFCHPTSYPQLPGPFQLTLSDSDPALFPRGKSSLWSQVPLIEPSIL